MLDKLCRPAGTFASASAKDIEASTKDSQAPASFADWPFNQ